MGWFCRDGEDGEGASTAFLPAEGVWRMREDLPGWFAAPSIPYPISRDSILSTTHGAAQENHGTTQSKEVSTTVFLLRPTRIPGPRSVSAL